MEPDAFCCEAFKIWENELTGGQSGGIDDLDRLITEISAKAENKETVEIYELWNDWRWGLGLLFLLAVYWVSRKILGLI